MGRMFNPPHPGESIREDILPALGIAVTEAAKHLGVARVTLSRLIHGQSGVSADMARRLEAWLGGPKHGPSAESWLKIQADYDLWQACSGHLVRDDSVLTVCELVGVRACPTL